jgi:hypothetical protein
VMEARTRAIFDSRVARMTKSQSLEMQKGWSFAWESGRWRHRNIEARNLLIDPPANWFLRGKTCATRGQPVRHVAVKQQA